MKLLASSKWLFALLAVLTVGMGVQTYYLIQVHEQLETSEVQASEVAQLDDAGDATHDGQGATVPSDPPSGLVPVDPLDRLGRAEDRVRRLFDDFYERFDAGFGDPWLDRPTLLADGDSFFMGNTGQFGPRVDLQDRGDYYELTVDVPGSEETDVVVLTDGQVLVIEGTRDTTTEESQPGSYVRRERQFGHFERRLRIPEDADPSTLSHGLENGVLRVTLHKHS